MTIMAAIQAQGVAQERDQFVILLLLIYSSNVIRSGLRKAESRLTGRTGLLLI